MPRIAWPVAALVLITLIIGACHTDSTSPIEHVAGTYTLVAVNDTTLPVTTVVDYLTRTVASGTLTVTDSTYNFLLCINAPGATGDASCGNGKLAIVDSGLVWSTGAGSSFVDRISHNSRALIVTGDTLKFQRSDLATPRLTFVR